MWAVLNLSDILQLIIHRFNQRTVLNRILSATLIGEFFMLFFTFVISCMPLRNRFSNNVCLIYPLSAHSLPLMLFRNLPCLKWFLVTHVPGHKHEIQDFAFAIDNQMQFEPEKPARRIFAPFGKPFESLMNQDLLITTRTQQDGIYKADSGTRIQLKPF